MVHSFRISSFSKLSGKMGPISSQLLTFQGDLAALVEQMDNSAADVWELWAPELNALRGVVSNATVPTSPGTSSQVPWNFSWPIPWDDAPLSLPRYRLRMQNPGNYIEKNVNEVVSVNSGPIDRREQIENALNALGSKYREFEKALSKYRENLEQQISYKQAQIEALIDAEAQATVANLSPDAQGAFMASILAGIPAPSEGGKSVPFKPVQIGLMVGGVLLLVVVIALLNRR